MNVEALYQHICRFISLDEQEFEVLKTYFTPVELSKKEILLKENAPCNALYFVVKGCIRKFFLKENGIEQTIDFAIENWWIADARGFEENGKAEFSLQAVEPVFVLTLTIDHHNKLLDHHPRMALYFYKVFFRAHTASQRRIKLLYTYSREALYFHFSKQFPEFTQRVPQYLLASFLGFTPEYLSEIRKKKFS